MDRDKEIQIIAKELGRLAPDLMRTRSDGSLYLDPDDCRTMALMIFNRLAMNRRGERPSSP